MNLLQSLSEKLVQRKEANLLRSLKTNNQLIDFSSNDYLGFARSTCLKAALEQELVTYPNYLNGSTGSRLLSGNSTYAENLENEIALFHNAEAGLIFNSGYDANLGLFSSIADKETTIITDELIHASIIDGIRLSYAKRAKFKHNDLNSLELELKKAGNKCIVVVESIYSMDGDMAPLKEIALLTEQYGAALIVDEAHATGVIGHEGKGLVQEYQLEKIVFARIHTFGKALGAHGAIVLGSTTLRDYLINFARSFIYTTAQPFHNLALIHCAYQQVPTAKEERNQLNEIITYFRNEAAKKSTIQLSVSESPIQSVLISGNELCRAKAAQLQSAGFDVRAILSPTVPEGKERLRICLHSYNTQEEIAKLISKI